MWRQRRSGWQQLYSIEKLWFQGPNLWLLFFTRYPCCLLFRHHPDRLDVANHLNMASRTIPPLKAAANTTLTTLATHWSGSIHLHMLASPLRKCIVTQKVLPTSLLIQLKPVTLPLPPSSTTTSNPIHRERTVLLPNAILSAKIAPKKPGKGIYLTCDRRIYAELESRASYKSVDPKAGLAKGMAELIARQLGERCCSELDVLVERFKGRRKGVDLFRMVQEGEAGRTSFAIRMSDGEDQNWTGIQVFQPKFSDQEQRQRFKTALQTLTKSSDKDQVYYAKQSHITAPLGIALYRLNLWSHPSR